MQSITSFQRLHRLFHSSNVFIIELFDTIIYKGPYYLKKNEYYDYKCNIENMNLESYVIVYIPQLNLLVFILKGFLSSRLNSTFLSTVYKVYLKDKKNNKFTTNFHTLNVETTIHDNGNINMNTNLNLDTDSEGENEDEHEHKNENICSILIYTSDDECILIDDLYSIYSSLPKLVYGKLPENIEKEIRKIFISDDVIDDVYRV